VVDKKNVFKTLFKQDIVAAKEIPLNKYLYGLRELKSLSRFDHPRVLKWKGACLSDNFLYLFTELAKFSLEDYLGSPEYKRRHGLKIALQVAEGLVFLHSNRIIHRNIKPSNILLFENLEAKIGDLGLACTLSENTSALFQATTGTLRWMAPEMFDLYGAKKEGNCEMKPYTEKVDIFSFGVLLWQQHSKASRLLIKALPAFHRPPIAENTDQRISKLITSCWEEKPEKRPSAVQVCESLKLVLAELQN